MREKYIYKSGVGRNMLRMKKLLAVAVFLAVLLPASEHANILTFPIGVVFIAAPLLAFAFEKYAGKIGRKILDERLGVKCFVGAGVFFWAGTLLFSVLLWLGFRITVPTVDFFAEHGLFPQIAPQILGIGALDQTSIAEFMFYGALLACCAKIAAFVGAYAPDDIPRAAKTLFMIPAVIWLLAALSFSANSFAILYAYTFAKGFTIVRLAGEIFAAMYVIWQLGMLKNILRVLIARRAR